MLCAIRCLTAKCRNVNAQNEDKAIEYALHWKQTPMIATTEKDDKVKN